MSVKIMHISPGTWNVLFKQNTAVHVRSQKRDNFLFFVKPPRLMESALFVSTFWNPFLSIHHRWIHSINIWTALENTLDGWKDPRYKCIHTVSLYVHKSAANRKNSSKLAKLQLSHSNLFLGVTIVEKRHSFVSITPSKVKTGSAHSAGDHIILILTFRVKCHRILMFHLY